MKSKTVIGITGAVSGVVVLADIGIAAKIFRWAMIRPDAETLAKDEKRPGSEAFRNAINAALPWVDTQKIEKLSISAYDGLKLQGNLLRTGSDKVVIAVHGYHSNGMREYTPYLKFYHDLGYNVLMPDDRAHGESEGKYIGFGWNDRLDVIKWIRKAIELFGSDTQIILHGISMGAAAVLMASGEELPRQVKAVISDCAFASVEEEFKYQLKHMFHLPEFPVLQTFDMINRHFNGYRLKEASALGQVSKSDIPTLFIHGGKDDFVPTYMVFELFEACSAPKDMIIIDGASHAQSHIADPGKYENAVKEFIERYTETDR